MAIVTVVFFSFWAFRDYFDPPAGDFEVRQGSIHLESGEFQEALQDFDTALEIQPMHRGAMMGRAIAFLQMEEYTDAEEELNNLIQFLETERPEDDMTGIGVLAAAYANRGILKDRLGRYEEALEDYARALVTDEESVDGPGIAHKILYAPNPSTVRDRAKYIQQQLKLPEDQRVLAVPEIDGKQRMYKP